MHLKDLMQDQKVMKKYERLLGVKPSTYQECHHTITHDASLTIENKA